MESQSIYVTSIEEIACNGQGLEIKMATPAFFLFWKAKETVGYEACAKLNYQVELK